PARWAGPAMTMAGPRGVLARGRERRRAFGGGTYSASVARPTFESGASRAPARWRCASMRKSSFRTAALALVGTLFVGVAAYAADPPATTDQHRQAYESRLQQKLGLAADQVPKLRDIHTRDFA